MHQVGKYEIVSEIGRGAMGVVYKARDPLIGRLVALKTITSAVTAQGSLLERFYQEARSAGALQHPNIVTIYELGHENNTPFIAMEYIEGRSLDQMIEQRQVLPLSLKLGYAVRVCEALSYAHRHNVVHRDIKPANIMVTKEGVVKVVDFGIARLTDMSLTQPNMMIGSRAYMSPQLYKGERADARADIWAVGVTLYELLACRRPFLGDSEAELMFHILSDPPPALQSVAADCTDELSGIVGRMLEKKAEDRYQTMEDVSRDLEPLWKSAQQATVAGLLADCQQLMAANDLQRAQGLLRKALQIDVTNTQAKSLLEKVTTELRRSQVLPKVNEHLERGRVFLQTGRLREARSEVEAALGLDSRHEPAQKLRAELEEAVARVQEVEQKLRLTKQRLAEGALTEAAAALASALELDGANPQAQDLRRQIDEERNRREKRKKLSEVLHHARTLWTALSYEECLNVLALGLKEFPDEPELTKLQEMARHDMEDLQKQRQMGDVRKLLGEQKFSEARRIADVLVKKYPQETALKNLQVLATEGEHGEIKRRHFAEEIAVLRALLSSGKFGDAVGKGDALLCEYPQEFELKELVAYARGELAQQVQRQREKEIRELIEREQYREAEASARRIAQEFPNQEIFLKLADEAGQKKQAQEQRVRAHQEMLRRIDEIRGNISQEGITESIAFAQRTLATFGPHPTVTQLLNAAAKKQEEFNKKERQEEQLAAARTMIDAGDFAGATQALNHAMATQIFERSDPRIQRRLREIEHLATAPSAKPAADRRTSEPKETGRTVEKNKSHETTVRGVSTPSHPPMFSESAVLEPETGGKQSGTRVRENTSPSAVHEVTFPFRKALIWVQGSWDSLTQIRVPALHRPAVLGGVAGAAAIVLTAVILLATNRGPSKKEKELRDHALQLWSAHELDASEQTWRRLEGLRGTYQKAASQQIKDIENKRQRETQLFQEGERLLNDQKEYTHAAQTFQDVVEMNLWVADKARVELGRAEASSKAQETSNLEQQHFDQGKAFFENKAYDQARKEFQAARDVNVPNSVLQPQIDSYLKKVAQNADAKKLYDQALADIKQEDWEGAQRQLQELVHRKGEMSGEAKQRLAYVASAQKAQESFRQSLQVGNYSNAKSQLDDMQQWPKTKERLLKELLDIENKQAAEINSRANALQASGDADGLEHLQNELHNFAGRINDASLLKWAGELDKWLTATERKLREEKGEKVAFDAAVADFNTTKEKGDLSRMDHEVLQKFQTIAKGSGPFRAQAQEFVEKTIPAAMQEMTKTLGKGRMILPPIACTGAQTGAAAAVAAKQSVTCSQMDADVSLQWIGTPTVEFPATANQPGKLPYTLRLIVFVDPTGKVRIEKDGNADKDFFKKAKDASKNWKTTSPKAGGKPVTVSFPFSINFHQ